MACVQIIIFRPEMTSKDPQKERADYSEIALLTSAWMKFNEILTHFPK